MIEVLGQISHSRPLLAMIKANYEALFRDKALRPQVCGKAMER